ncbi:WSC domain-containing protein [Fusarium oxysporum f. sp. conglutinans]|nr:WSC domain-containing protein [Fusarium oxysporum f. sp. conglutinans]
MASPLNGVPTLGKPNRNGFASSILAWLGGSKNITGQRNFEGYRIHSELTIGIEEFSEACQNALTALVRCDNIISEWRSAAYHGILPIEVDVDSICDKDCAEAISDWLSAVDTYCGDSKWENGAAAGVMGSFISYGINETCQTDKKTGKYCNDVILGFSNSGSLESMPNSELCSDCYVGRLKMMQASPFSYYRKEPYYQNALKAAVSRCPLSNQPTSAKDSPFPSETTEDAICLSDVNTYKLETDDTCMSVAIATGLQPDTIRLLNPWIHELCGNIQTATETLGRVICTTTPGGKYEHDVNSTNSDPAYSEYADKSVSPPKGATIAQGTTEYCGRWYTVQKGDDCARVLVQHHISLLLFTSANPSVSQDTCSSDLIPGQTYCVGPTKDAFVDRTPIPPYWRYGCYARQQDTGNHSVLIFDEVNHVKPMSIVACQSYCLSYSWYVFGLQNGDSCLCDSRLRMDSRLVNDSKCNIHCNGNTTNLCGGSDAVQVFSDESLLRVEHTSLGCFIQNDSKHVLDGETIDEKDMSVEKCASICTINKKSDFFSLSEGSICTCGQKVATWAKKTDAGECNVKCIDQMGDTCGGKGRAEVHTTKTKNAIAT